MKKPVLTRYRVDNVPIFIRPQFYLYGYAVGLLLFLFVLCLRMTIKFKISGREKLSKDPNHIFCLWHTFVPLALIGAMPQIPVVLDRSAQVWMQHPAWYMKPIHVLLRLMGVKKIILGSTGHSGRDAAERLVVHLKRGCSTVLNPDGPHGPNFILKKGILHLSLNSGIPIVPLRFSASHFRELKTWDRKKIPYPFSKLEMEFGAPFHVSNANFEYAQGFMEKELG